MSDTATQPVSTAPDTKPQDQLRSKLATAATYYDGIKWHLRNNPLKVNWEYVAANLRLMSEALDEAEAVAVENLEEVPATN